MTSEMSSANYEANHLVEAVTNLDTSPSGASTLEQSEQPHVHTLAEILLREWMLLRSRNPSYSMRQFAKRLNLSPATLSLVFAGKRRLSHKRIEKIGKALNLDPIDIASIRELTDDNSTVDERLKRLGFDRRSVEELRSMGDWLSHAIIAFCKINLDRIDVNVIAQKIGVPLLHVEQCVERLLVLGFLTQSEDGALASVEKVQYFLDREGNEHATRRYIGETMHLAMNQFYQFEPEIMYLNHQMIPVSKQNLKKIYRKMTDFIAEISAISQEGSVDEVYMLNLDFLPVTQTGSGKLITKKPEIEG